MSDKRASTGHLLSTKAKGPMLRLMEQVFILGYLEGSGSRTKPSRILLKSYMTDFEDILESLDDR